MSTPNFQEFENLNESYKTELQNYAQEFVKEKLGLGERENAIEMFALKNKINYLDFAGAVIDEIRRQFAM
jgi:hypothetical protein